MSMEKFQKALCMENLMLFKQREENLFLVLTMRH